MVQCSVLLDLPWYGSPRPIPIGPDPFTVHTNDHPQGWGAQIHSLSITIAHL